MTRRSSMPIVAVLVVSLLCAGAARYATLEQRRRLDESSGMLRGAGSNLNRLSSFTLGLVLGGLRGPLVMALWSSSESQKTERNLADIDTKIDLIRQLQPEYDAVHLFQIWNKAYNLSVQMANIPNKYTTILDALDYGRQVDAERPESISIIAEIGRLYFGKFGGAAEKGYFSPRLQQETLPEAPRVRVIFPNEQRQKVLREARLAGASRVDLQPRPFTSDTATATPVAKPHSIILRKPDADTLQQRLNDPQVRYEVLPARAGGRRTATGRPTAHEVLLDENYEILGKHVAPRGDRQPADDASSGAELPYLRKLGPYRYGVSPYGLAFNYYKRAQWLQYNRGQRHSQMSDRVISSQPGMAMKKWGEEQWFAARRAEIELFNLPIPEEESQLEAPTQAITIDSPIVNCPLLEEIIWRYQNAATLAEASVAEFDFHLLPDHFPSDIVTYASHREGSAAQAFLMRADALYLKAMLATGDQRKALATQAGEQYRLAQLLYARHILRYFMGDEDAPSVLPRGVTRMDVNDVNKLPDVQLGPALARLEAKHAASAWSLPNSEDFREIIVYIHRANARLKNINAAIK